MILMSSGIDYCVVLQFHWLQLRCYNTHRLTVHPLTLGIYKNKTRQSLFVEHSNVSPSRETFAMAGEQDGRSYRAIEGKIIH